MEILATNTGWGFYVPLIAMVGALGSLFLVCAVWGLNGVTANDLASEILAWVITVGFAVVIALIVRQGPDVTYEAKITDFNVVHDRSYEIIDHHGEIYTLRKAGE